jgi:hypothetical protein
VFTCRSGNKKDTTFNYNDQQTTSSSSSSPNNVKIVPSVSPSTETPKSALLLKNGFPGYQYTVVEPNNQYQKYLIVVIQALSGTSPVQPPRYQPTLEEDGTILKVQVPLSPVFNNTNLLTNSKVSWMSNATNGNLVEYKNTRLAGIGPAIAQVQAFCNSNEMYTEWRLPLGERCDEIIGSYSINNFPSGDRFGPTFSPVLVEFKLSTVEQRVKKEAKVEQGLWLENGESEDGSLSVSALDNGHGFTHNSNLHGSQGSSPNKHGKHH